MFNYLTGYARPRGYRKVAGRPVQPPARGSSTRSSGRSSRTRAGAAGPDPDEDELAARRARRSGRSTGPRRRGCRVRAQRARDLRAAARGRRASRRTSRSSRSSAASSSTRGSTRSSAGGEDARVYIGSADLMPRNLYNRVELVAPVEDARIRAELLDVLDRSLADNTNAWALGADGDWTRREPRRREPRSVQRELIERHLTRAAESAPRCRSARPGRRRRCPRRRRR